jgi:hypothetical protein
MFVADDSQLPPAMLTISKNDTGCAIANAYVLIEHINICIHNTDFLLGSVLWKLAPPMLTLVCLEVSL